MEENNEKIVQDEINNATVNKGSIKNNKKSKKNFEKKVLIIVVIMLVLVIGISISYILFWNKNNVRNENNQNAVEENTNIDNKNESENIDTEKAEETDKINSTNDLEETNYAKEYLKIIGKIETDYPESNITCDLIYFNNDNIPDLVIGISEYWVSLYIYENSIVYNPVDQWSYGAGGNSGYSYQEKKGAILNFDTDFAGAIFSETILILNSKNEFDEFTFTGEGASVENEDQFIQEEVKKALKQYGGYFYNNQKLSEQEYNNKLKELSVDFDENKSKILYGEKSASEIKKELQQYSENMNKLDESSLPVAIEEVKK